jgi:antitoxin component of MazEF toxin-antitoxin module
MSTKHAAADRWREIIHQQQVSGLSALAFCRRAGVPQSSFFAWRKKLLASATFMEVKVSPAAASMIGGDSVAESVAQGSGIELRLPGRRCMVVRPGFDRRTLIELLHVLEMNTAELDAQQADTIGAMAREKGV